MCPNSRRNDTPGTGNSKRFVEEYGQAGKRRDEQGRFAPLLEAASLIGEAAERDDGVRAAVDAAVAWANRGFPVDEESIRLRKDLPISEGEGGSPLDLMMDLMASGAIAANEGLRSPQAMEKLRERLRDGRTLLEETSQTLESTSRETLSEAMLQTHRRAASNKGFAKAFAQAKREIQGIGPDLHQRVRGRGEDRRPTRDGDLPPVSGGSPWEVGIVVTCSLAWWVCAAAAVVVFGIVIGYLIWTWVN